MSGAERAQKKRIKACLFPQKRQAADLDRIRKYDKERKRNKVAAAKKATSVAQQMQVQQQVQQQKGMFRWPMSAEARNMKKAACCYMRCNYCGELVVDTYGDQQQHFHTCVVAAAIRKGCDPSGL